MSIKKNEGQGIDEIDAFKSGRRKRGKEGERQKDGRRKDEKDKCISLD